MNVWLRSERFDVGLQVGALATIAPAVLAYALLDGGRAASLVPLASLFAIPFLHVFGSFFFAFSGERNRSPSPPRRLAVLWAAWAALALALMLIAPRVLATFALLYGGWHIFRQNFGFMRELARRAGRAADPRLRRLDHAASAAPAIALWLLIMARGPWRFIGAADVLHLAVPSWLLALAFVAVPATAFLRHRAAPSTAALLLLAGNAIALLGPALVIDDLMVIYTLSASYHGIQYLAYLAVRERETHPGQQATLVLVPLASAIVLSMLGMVAALMLLVLVLPGRGEQALGVLWYTVVPFHYFVDGKIWRRRSAGPQLA